MANHCRDRDPTPAPGHALRLLLLAALVACAPPTPTPPPLSPLARLQQGDVAAVHALAQPGVAPEVQALAAQLVALEPERAAIRAVEAPMMAQSSREAAEAGDIGAAAARLALGLRSFPDNSDLHAVLEQLSAEVAQAPAPTRAAASAALAEALAEAGQPTVATALRRQAAEAAIEARYTSGQLATTRAGQQGIRDIAATSLLTELDRAYVTAVPWNKLCKGASAAMHTLATTATARAQWPALGDVALPQLGTAASASDATAQLLTWIKLLGAAGVPSEVVIDEWVLAGLHALDPWTRVVWPAEIRGWQEGHAGIYQGVGLELKLDSEGNLRVVKPLPSGPAWTSGIHQGDALLRITDTTSGEALTVSAVPADDREAWATRAMAGEPGTRVALQVQRASETLEFSITRGPVVPETLRGDHRADDNTWRTLFDVDHGLAYVAIERFKPGAELAFDRLIDGELNQIQGLVLDLRGNPGGDVNAAVQIADRFIADGLLADLQGRVRPETGPDVDPVTGAPLAEWNAGVPGHALEGVPVVVLVDEDTASAAEVLAGALQERVHAKVVGAPTWGKGLAQVIHTDLESGYAAQYTNLVWTLPSGRRLARELDGGGGIQPDVLVPMSAAEQYQVDRQARLDGALRTHHDGTPMRPPDPGRRTDLPPLSADPMRIMAALLLRAQLAGG